MTNYETIFILRADLTDAGMKKIHDKLSEVIRAQGGTPAPLKDLGKRPLAYRIKKQMRGHYFQLNYQGPGGVIGELERSLRLSEEVLRFLTVSEKKKRGALHDSTRSASGQV